MESTKFRIVGEQAKKRPLSEYKLAFAEVTDTRLMGVVGMHIRWILKECEPKRGQDKELALQRKQELEEDNIVTVFHQFYYFEAEEYGLESLTEIWTDEPQDVALAKDKKFGGLGCKFIPLKKREALYMIHHLIEETIARTPKNTKNFDKNIFSSLTNNPGLTEIINYAAAARPFTEEEIQEVNKKLCVHIASEFGLINYYVMRCVGHDEEGRQMLISSDADPEKLVPIALKKRGTMRRNSITPFVTEDFHTTFLCETLVDVNNTEYSLIFSEVEVLYGKVVSSKINNCFPISFREGELKLRRPEYITFYDIDSDNELFDEDFEACFPKTTKRFYPNGVLFMEYFNDNSHVEQQIFNLSDDLKASFFLTEAGQLVIASYSNMGIVSAESELQMSPFADEIVPIGRYSFNHPILGDFISSGYDDFVEYLRALL